MLWRRLPTPQFLVLRFFALFSANVIAQTASQLEGWRQGLVYVVAGSVLIWALAGILRLGYQRWRR